MPKRSEKSIAPDTTDVARGRRGAVVLSALIVPAIQQANDSEPGAKDPATNRRAPIKIVGRIVTGLEVLTKNLHHPLASLTADERCRAARKAIGRLIVSIARKKESQ